MWGEDKMINEPGLEYVKRIEGSESPLKQRIAQAVSEAARTCPPNSVYSAAVIIEDRGESQALRVVADHVVQIPGVSSPLDSIAVDLRQAAPGIDIIIGQESGRSANLQSRERVLYAADRYPAGC